MVYKTDYNSLLAPAQIEQTTFLDAVDVQAPVNLTSS